MDIKLCYEMYKEIGDQEVIITSYEWENIDVDIWHPVSIKEVRNCQKKSVTIKLCSSF